MLTSSASCGIRRRDSHLTAVCWWRGKVRRITRLWQYGSRARRIRPRAQNHLLEEAVRKMTSLPAEHFRFARRGRLELGYAADVVIFDPSSVRDSATFERPHARYRHPVRVGERRRRGSRRPAHRDEVGPRSEARHAVTFLTPIPRVASFLPQHVIEQDRGEQDRSGGKR